MVTSSNIPVADQAAVASRARLNSKAKWIEAPEWFEMMDVANALKDHRILQLPPRRSWAVMAWEMSGPEEKADYHAFTIAGGPYGPIGGTHVFPRSSGVGNLIAQLIETTQAGASPYTFGNVNVEWGEYYRGRSEIVLPADLPLKLRQGKRKADTWNGLREGLRALRDRSRLDTYIENNPEKIKQSKRDAREWSYLNNHFVAVDFEGQDYLGNVIVRPNGANTPYDDHRLFMGWATSIDKNKLPEWLGPRR